MALMYSVPVTACAEAVGIQHGLQLTAMAGGILAGFGLCGPWLQLKPSLASYNSNFDSLFTYRSEMGASGWSYWATYQSDINQVLQDLRSEVFASGNFTAPDDWESADISEYLFDEVHGDTDAMKKLIEESPIERLRVVAGFEGTHSIIDVFAVEQEPRSNTNEWELAVDDLGKVFPLADSELEALFGTTKPSRSQVEPSVSDLMDSCERFTGKYVVAYGSGIPHAILFVGVSGD